MSADDPGGIPTVWNTLPLAPAEQRDRITPAGWEAPYECEAERHGAGARPATHLSLLINSAERTVLRAWMVCAECHERMREGMSVQ